MKLLIIACLVLGLYPTASAEEITLCSQNEAMKAETSIPKLKNWPDIYKSFIKYNHCDDGGIAEGYSEVIVRTLALDWPQIETLAKIISFDKTFLKFVIKHIDATTAKSDLEKIKNQSITKCPKEALKICPLIEEKAEKTLEEL